METPIASKASRYGSEFKRGIKRYYPAPIGFTPQAPSLPSPTNYVDIDPEAKDAYGVPAVRISISSGARMSS